MSEQSRLELKLSLSLIRAETQNKEYKNHIRRLTESLKRITDGLSDIPEQKWTGWYVLLAKDENAVSGLKFVGMYNPDVYEEEEDEPEWDAAIPIPVIKTMPEFVGW
jgi:hypothetical protein